MLSYRYRLYPSKAQEQRLQANLDVCRWLYNYFLAQMREPRDIARAYGWLSFKGVPSRHELQAQLPMLKQAYTFLTIVNSKALQMVLHQLYSNLRALAGLKKKGKRVGGLRYKGKAWYKTLTFNQSGYKLRGKKLWLSKIGEVNIKHHRPIKGVIKQVKIKHEASGRWYAVMSVDAVGAKPKKAVIARSEHVIGVDVNLCNYLVDSDGHEVVRPHFIAETEERLAKAQRRLSRKKEGSRNRARQGQRVARLHERVANQRRDFLHKLSRYYVDRYDCIAHEHLDAKEMREESYNGGDYADTAWNIFYGMLAYKAERAGKLVMKVNPVNTSQDCARCGAHVHKPLWVRHHYCPICGFAVDRDLNAAWNIKLRALDALGLERPEVTPVETTPLHLHPLQRQASPRKQEAPCESAG